MPRRKMLPSQLRGYCCAAVTFFALSSSLIVAYETRPLVGLDLVEDRTAEMMESMKTGMSINFLEAALLEATRVKAVESGGGDGDAVRGPVDQAVRADAAVVFPSYSLTDVDGVVHKCTVREELETKPSNTKTKTKTGTKTKTKPITDVSTALDPLEGVCATLPDGYWSYKWCHRRDVIQFHDDVASTVVVNLGTHTRTEVKRSSASPTSADTGLPNDEDAAGRAFDTQTSSGTGTDAETNEEGDRYPEEDGADGQAASKASKAAPAPKKKAKAKAKRSNGKRKSRSAEDDLFQGITDFSELAAVHDFYEEGDFCEETGQQRSLKTSITCCPADRLPAGLQAISPVAVLVSIKEVSTCSYLAKVCSRLLCPAATDELALGQGEGSSGGAVATRAGGVLGMLQELEACFPSKKGTWWSYKLCLLEGISQYHEELFQKPDGRVFSKITDEFSLGEWDRSEVTGEGEGLIHRGQRADGEAGAIVLEFTGGTECDLTGVLRSTTVHLKCGIRPEVREVIEDRTCHYRILAFSPNLCSHPALTPKKEAVRTVECVPEEEWEQKQGKLRETGGKLREARTQFNFLRRMLAELSDTDH